MTIGDLLDDNYDESLNEVDGTLVASGVFLSFLAALQIYPSVKKKINENKSMYWVSDRPVKKIPDKMQEDPKIAIAREAYISGLKKAENGTLYYSDDTEKILKKKCILNKGCTAKPDKVSQVFQGTLEEMCKKYSIKLEKIDKSKFGDRKKVKSLAIKLIKEKLKSNGFDYISKASIGKEDDSDFIDGVEDRLSLSYISLYDITPNARSEFGEDETNKKLEPIFKTVKDINSKNLLPKGYSLDTDGDWDDYIIDLVYNDTQKESVGMNNIGDLLDSNNYIDSIEEEVNEPETFTVGDMLDEDVSYDCTEESLQELFKYKNVKVEPEVSREEAYNIAQGVFDKALNGKYKEYDYAVLKSGASKNEFLKQTSDSMILYTFNISEDYQKTVGIGSDGNLTTSTTTVKSDEFRKCEAIIRKIIQEANEALSELGGFVKKGKIFNRKGVSVPYFRVYMSYEGYIFLEINKEKKKINKKTGEYVSESFIEE